MAGNAIVQNFLGNAPGWYKAVIVGFFVLNPVLLWSMGPVIAGWVLVGEFIFTLAMALKCYPLQPGGLLALEAVALGMTCEIASNRDPSHNRSISLITRVNPNPGWGHGWTRNSTPKISTICNDINAMDCFRGGVNIARVFTEQDYRKRTSTTYRFDIMSF